MNEFRPTLLFCQCKPQMQHIPYHFSFSNTRDLCTVQEASWRRGEQHCGCRHWGDSGWHLQGSNTKEVVHHPESGSRGEECLNLLKYDIFWFYVLYIYLFIYSPQEEVLVEETAEAEGVMPTDSRDGAEASQVSSNVTEIIITSYHFFRQIFI